MKQIQRIAVLLSMLIVWVKACDNCPQENSLPKLSDHTDEQCSASDGDECSGKQPKSFVTSHLKEDQCDDSNHAKEASIKSETDADNGQCSASDGDQCSGEQPKSFVTSHLKEDQCDDSNHAKEASIKSETVVDSNETPQKSPQKFNDDDSIATPDIQKETKKIEKKVNEKPEEIICEKYKKKFSQELLSGMNAADGLVLHEFIDGKLYDYMDKVFDKALSDNSDQLKEELWDIMDEVEVGIEDKFRRAIEKRDKDNMFEWMYVHGQALSNDYKKCCLEMFSRAESILKEHDATLDLSKSLEV